MGVISQNGIDYPVPSVPVQSDGSATDLTNAAVPTGQTIKSYLNSNFGTFVFISNVYSTINGYVSVVNSAIKTTSLVFVQINRNDDANATWSGYSAYPRISANGEVIIFIRDANGSYPANGKLISLNILVHNA